MRNNFLLSTIFVIIAAILYAYFAKPWGIAVYEKYDRSEKLKETLLQADKIQERRDDLQARRINLSGDVERVIANAVPDNAVENKVQFFIALDRLIAQSGLATDTRYSIGDEQKEEDGYTIIPVSFTFESTNYTILRNFISNIQRWNRGVRIHSLRIISPKTDESAELVGGATLVLEVFFTSSVNESP